MSEANGAKMPMTPQGYETLLDELKQLKGVERHKIIDEIATARAKGDLSENAEYHAAREQQGHIEARIKMLESAVSRAQVIDVNDLSGDSVKFGATVRLADEDSDAESVYQLVGEMEADATKGRISVISPLARALMGKKAGDSAQLRLPAGERSYEILEVQFK